MINGVFNITGGRTLITIDPLSRNPCETAEDYQNRNLEYLKEIQNAIFGEDSNGTVAFGKVEVLNVANAEINLLDVKTVEE